ncbi:putative P-type ATPase [Dichotomocladium elegans]|nr:putative P-type ATPase [Dichotomocladium elegans]
MSTHPSAWNLAGYGTSRTDVGDSNTTRPQSPDPKRKQRRDSAAPLMHTPPIGGSQSQNETSFPNPLITPIIGDLRSSGLYRRRHKPEDDDKTHGKDDGKDTGSKNEEDEGVSSSDDEDDDNDDEEYESDNESQTSDRRTLVQQTGDDIRISGLDLEENPCRQKFMLEEETEIVIEGYRYDRVGYTLYRLFSVLTCGLVWLVCRWMPHWWIAWVGQRAALGDAQWLVFVNQYGERDIIRPQHEFYGGAFGSVFSLDQVKNEMRHRHHDRRRVINMDEKMPHLILVEYRYVRLAYHPILRKFLAVGYWKDAHWSSLKNIKTGLSSEKYQQRSCVFGPNLINIREKPTMKLLCDEVLNPFYVFQIASIILWCLDDYYYYAFCIFLISAISIISTLIETKETMKRMRDMSKFECTVRIFRNGSWRSISSTELVPGDLIDIANLTVVPCDAVLISGDCILNESMLTGESVPVSKLPVTDSVLRKMNLSSAAIPAEISKHFLFMGTKVVRVRSGDTISPATAMVVRTGFNSAKGALIRSMLFPKPNNFKFYRDSFRFIGVLSIIAMSGFLISSINFIRLGIDKTTMLLRALDLITIVVPPALPATMSIGTSFAISRLKKLGIFCISPPRVNIGGKIDCMCFDKTGTLTEDGLDIHGIRSVSIHGDNKRMFDEETRIIQDTNLDDKDDVTTKAHILRVMTTCHSLKIVDGELIGDPLDLKMFEYTGWELEESGGALSSGLKMRSELAALQPKKSAKVGIMPTVVRPPGSRQDLVLNPSNTQAMAPVEFGIIHTFEFVSALRRMSVIVRRLANPCMEVFVKGAPEVMADICSPESLPVDYKEVLYWYTHRGYRVIACAARQLNGVKWHKLHKLKRQEVESDLTFLGFIVFENKLKPRTTLALKTLRDAGIRQIMCTGDNVLTAISVSRECGLVDEHAEIYIPKFLSGSSTDPRSELSWDSVLTEGYRLRNDTLEPLQSDFYGRPYYLALTGEAFRWMIDNAPTELLHRMLVKGAIYARMSPDEKQELVSELQNIEYCVGFCGDGANDCGALKAGDIGISLSEAEASVAAPFTSNTMDIACVIDVIKEGRAALVTSFSCFKYMALYSIIQFTSVTLLYAFGSNLGDFQFLYIDLFLILPIAVYMGYTDSWPHLARKRPTASLVSKKVLTSLIGQILINSNFQFIAYWMVHQQDWYKPPVFDPDGENIECYENTVLFLLSSFQYIFVAIVFSVGPPYRKPLWSNGRLLITLAVLVTLTTWCVILPSTWVMEWLELEAIPFTFRMLILMLAWTNLGVSLVSEKYLFPHMATWISDGLKRVRHRTRPGYASLPKAHKKVYKRVMQELGVMDM